MTKKAERSLLAELAAGKAARRKAAYRRQTLARSADPKRKAYLAEYRKKNRAQQNAYKAKYNAARAQEYYAANREIIAAQRMVKAIRFAAGESLREQRKRKQENADALRIAQKERRRQKAAERSKSLKNCPRRAEYLKKYYIKNAARRRKYLSDYLKTRKANDPEFKLRLALRKRTNQVLARFSIEKTFQKPMAFLGCTVAELREHLEKQFEPWMTWENHGAFGWHIDHIKPLSKFDLKDPKQFAQASHYTNLRPLHWRDNLSKHAKELN